MSDRVRERGLNFWTTRTKKYEAESPDTTTATKEEPRKRSAKTSGDAANELHA
jgi:hypothetical protein